MIFLVILSSYLVQMSLMASPTIFSNFSDSFSYLKFSSAIMVSIPTSNKFIIYGTVQSNNLITNCLYEFNYSPSNSLILISQICFDTSSSPNPTYKSCGIYDSQNDIIFVYGSQDSEQDANNLWTLSVADKSWYKLGQNGPQLQNCIILIQNNQIDLFGHEITHTQFSLYKIELAQIQTSQAWHKNDFRLNYGFIQTTRVGDQAKTINQFYKIDEEREILTSSATILDNIFCAKKYDNKILLVSLNRIYQYDPQQNILQVIQQIRFNLEEKPQCQITKVKNKNWLIINNYNMKSLYYLNLDNLPNFGVITYQTSASSSLLISLNNDIFILNSDFQIYLFESECTNLIQSFNQSSFVKQCFYSQIFCLQGFKGQNCTETLCQNTLKLFDQIGFTQIIYECSGNGYCSNGSCICDQFWSGSDCSMYTRQQCFGELIQNWPIMNCQCIEQTKGGNNCQVTFCYNDCTNHGSCLQTGVCECSQGYFGEDCSIVIIDFPGIFSIHEALQSF